MSIVELVILIIVILFGIRYWHMEPTFFSFKKNGIDTSNQEFWVASFLAIFLWTGYDAVVKLSEETKDSKNVVPKAVLTTVFVTSMIYILLAFTSICLPNLGEIASNVMPIAKICEHFFGQSSHIKIIYLIGLFIVLNTFFVCIISLSRFLYGLSKEDKLPKVLSEVNDRFKTPHNAIFAVFLAIAVATLIDNGEWAASFANIFFLLFLIMLCLAVIILRIKDPNRERTFKIPLNIGNFPIPVLLGILASLAYIALAFCSVDKIGRG